MTLTTPKWAFPYPEDTNDPDGPLELHDLATAIDTALDKPAGVQVGSTGLTIATSVTGVPASTGITLATEYLDPGGMHASTDNFVTVQTGQGGIWLVTVHATFAANVTGIRSVGLDAVTATLGAQYNVQNIAPAAPSGSTTIDVSAPIFAPDASLIHAMVGQSSGGNLSTSVILTAFRLCDLPT